MAAVPERFRPALQEVVARLVAKDYLGLVRNGFAPRHQGDSLGRWIEKYPGTLIELPDEAWEQAEAGEVTTHPGQWWVVVPLWTREEGRSDLSLEATVLDLHGRIRIEVDDIHVL